MSIAKLNQFHNEVMQDSMLQEQFNTAAAAQELSDAELESVAGGVKGDGQPSSFSDLVCQWLKGSRDLKGLRNLPGFGFGMTPPSARRLMR